MIRAGVVALIAATLLGTAASIATAVVIPPADGPAAATAGADTSEGGAVNNGVNGPGVAAGAKPAPQDTPYAGVISLKVDATDIGRHNFSVHETIPVKAGGLTLLYPQWLPGNHAPRGPIDGLAGLQMSVGGRRVDGRRGPGDGDAGHLLVP